MKAYWEKLSGKIDALNRRERMFVFLVLIALVWFLINSMLLEPVLQHKKSLSDQLNIDRAQHVSIQKKLQALANTSSMDPDIANRTRLKALKEQLQHANASLYAMQKELVSPDKMAQVLDGMLINNQKIKLVSLKTLPVITADKAAQLSVYRHGVDIKIQGRYLDLLSYLQTLEKLPWHMLWGNINLVADAYPQSTLTVNIYTLSLDQTWLSM